MKTDLFLMQVVEPSQVIYFEDFTGQNGTGWTGNSGTLPPFSSNLSSVDWTMDISNAYLSGVSDYFKVYNQRLAAGM